MVFIYSSFEIWTMFPAKLKLWNEARKIALQVYVCSAKLTFLNSRKKFWRVLLNSLNFESIFVMLNSILNCFYFALKKLFAFDSSSRYSSSSLYFTKASLKVYFGIHIRNTLALENLFHSRVLVIEMKKTLYCHVQIQPHPDLKTCSI